MGILLLHKTAYIDYNSHIVILRMKIMIRKIEDIETLYNSILKAAKDLFLHFGFKKTAVDDIARKARVAKGTIYNYFRSKEELFQKVFKDEGEKMIQRMREAVKEQNIPQDKIREMIISKIKHYKEFYLIHDSKRLNSDLLFPVIQQEQNEILKKEIMIITEILQDGVSRSFFYVKNIAATAKALAIAIKGLEIGWSLEMNIDEAVDEVDDLVLILIKGLEMRT